MTGVGPKTSMCRNSADRAVRRVRRCAAAGNNYFEIKSMAITNLHVAPPLPLSRTSRRRTREKRHNTHIKHYFFYILVFTSPSPGKVRLRALNRSLCRCRLVGRNIGRYTISMRSREGEKNRKRISLVIDGPVLPPPAPPHPHPQPAALPARPAGRSPRGAVGS